MIVEAPGAGTDPAPARVLDRQLASCLQRISGGDHDALALLYDVSGALLYPLLLRILGQAAEAEEVLLDVYTEVWRKAGSFDPARGSATSWLITLARSRAIDRLRSRAADRRREAPLATAHVAPAGASPEQHAMAGERRRLILDALARLADGQREAIELAFYEGLTHSEIAERLGQPLGTIKTRIRAGMTRLRALLGELAETLRDPSYEA